VLHSTASGLYFPRGKSCFGLSTRFRVWCARGTNVYDEMQNWPHVYLLILKYMETKIPAV